MQRWIIIVAGGIGSRMGGDVPKQFIPLKGRAIIRHTMARFHTALPDARQIIVLPAQHMAAFEDVIAQDPVSFPYQTTSGGDTRFASVKNGLSLIPDTPGIVGIHDAVRPLVPIDVIRHTFSVAAASGAAIPVIPVQDSIRHISNGDSKAVSRDAYRIVQTPQCFRQSWLRQAYDTIYKPAFTDDASVVEAAGRKVALVEGAVENIKITTPDDLQMAIFWLERQP